MKEKPKVKKIKSVKVWAIINPIGEISNHLSTKETSPLTIYRTRKTANECKTYIGEKVIPVLITPIIKSNKK